ncbi:MAG: response regulator [Anaerolineaceae bacterium]|nr:response regulator [Anaerolineaceae bacterium]
MQNQSNITISGNGNILIVDDNIANVKVLSQMLNSKGYNVRAVLEGTLVKAGVMAEPPDLILLDIMMPDISGFEVCSDLKNDPNTQDIPVIFISALQEVQDKITAFEVGGVDYISKPFQIEEVLARVETHLALSSLRQNLENMVAQRTKELQKTNEQLLIEIDTRLKMEKALTSSQRLADLGTLAAGVVHNIKTPLQLITGISRSLLNQMLKLDWEDAENFAKRLQNINESGWKINDILQSMMSYARQTQDTIGSYDLNQIVQDTLLLIEHQLLRLSNVRISTDLGNNLPPINCNRSKMIQVLINLITNARDAMSEGGDIHISTDYDPEKTCFLMQVADNGEGIPSEMHGQIFEAFFTTKSEDEGTGLGLFMVNNIVKELNGEVDLESKPGNGTKFTISIPGIF